MRPKRKPKPIETDVQLSPLVTAPNSAKIISLQPVRLFTLSEAAALASEIAGKRISPQTVAYHCDRGHLDPHRRDDRDSPRLDPQEVRRLFSSPRPTGPKPKHGRCPQCGQPLRK
jgi:hypothetical protein